MPDIAMCENRKCPSRKSCYRYTATPDEYLQTYSLFEVKEGESKCDSYIKNTSSRNMNNKK